MRNRASINFDRDRLAKSSLGSPSPQESCPRTLEHPKSFDGASKGRVSQFDCSISVLPQWTTITVDIRVLQLQWCPEYLCLNVRYMHLAVLLQVGIYFMVPRT